MAKPQDASYKVALEALYTMAIERIQGREFLTLYGFGAVVRSFPLSESSAEKMEDALRMLRLTRSKS